MHSKPSTCSRSSAAAQAPVRLSAQRLHELAVQAFRTGNRGRLSLCEALRVLHETRLFFDLGFPSLAAYAGVFFQLRRAETFEHVRVAKALIDLTELREAFGQGRLGWTTLKSITRVASVDSQADWLDFVRQNGVERTLAEAKDALRSRRDTPREGSFGLPNLDQKLVLRFSRSDMEKVRIWLEAGCGSVGSCVEYSGDLCAVWADRDYYVEGFCEEPVKWAVCADYYDEWIECLMNVESRSECYDCYRPWEWECLYTSFLPKICSWFDAKIR